MSYELEPAIRSRDTCQRTPCFDSCQLVIVFDKFTSASKPIKTAQISKHPKPCIRLARGKFESTNQDSAGGKNS